MEAVGEASCSWKGRGKSLAGLNALFISSLVVLGWGGGEKEELRPEEERPRRRLDAGLLSNHLLSIQRPRSEAPPYISKPTTGPPPSNLSPSPPSFHRLELLHALDHTLYALFVLSYLLSPSHRTSPPPPLTALTPAAVLSLVLRLASQVQFASPRHVHPGRSLRFFLSAWAVLNAGNVLVHAIDGSRGTKGRGWAGRGLMLDFVGQGEFLQFCCRRRAD